MVLHSISYIISHHIILQYMAFHHITLQHWHNTTFLRGKTSATQKWHANRLCKITNLYVRVRLLKNGNSRARPGNCCCFYVGRSNGTGKLIPFEDIFRFGLVSCWVVIFVPNAVAGKWCGSQQNVEIVFSTSPIFVCVCKWLNLVAANLRQKKISILYA